MGFCLINNIAVAANDLITECGAERVAIVDIDLHHGNGTQDLLRDEARSLFISSHQMPLYPGAGGRHEPGAQFMGVNRQQRDHNSNAGNGGEYGKEKCGKYFFIT